MTNSFAIVDRFNCFQQPILGVPAFLWYIRPFVERVPKHKISVHTSNTQVRQTAQNLGFSLQYHKTMRHLDCQFPFLLPENTWKVCNREPTEQTKIEMLGLVSADDAHLLDTVARGLPKNSVYLQKIEYWRQQLDIRMLILDCDGVLTNRAIAIDGEGHPIRQYNVFDGGSILALQEQNIPVALVTAAAQHPSITNRAKMLKIPAELQRYGVKNKKLVVTKLMKSQQIPPWHVAYIGDDIIDVEALQTVGHPFCPYDADISVLRCGAVRLTNKGGNGCIREVAEKIMERI